MHLILYDGNCPLCNRVVRVILKHDKKKKFLFAPLEGETAKPFHIEADTLALIENFHTKPKTYLRSRATFRIARHLGGRFALIGLFSCLPHHLFDMAYKAVAKRRYKLFSETVHIDPRDYEGRFLP
jgi:predicted DCC family thiol-disulfide oxidoreductase YuxK